MKKDLLQKYWTLDSLETYVWFKTKKEAVDYNKKYCGGRTAIYQYWYYMGKYGLEECVPVISVSKAKTKDDVLNIMK